MDKIEKFLQKKIFPDLEQGRYDWDLPHTKLVVKKIKKIIKENPELNLDEAVLIIAAYAHDWGYADLFKGSREGARYNKEYKRKHMEISANKLKELLKDPIFDKLSKKQKDRAIHIVSVHDKITEIDETDELVFMEADTLAGLDVTEVQPSYSKEFNDKYMKFAKESRAVRFITEYSKREFERLFKLRKEFYANL